MPVDVGIEKPTPTILTNYSTTNGFVISRIEPDSTFTGLRPNEPLYKAWPVLLINRQAHGEVVDSLPKRCVIAVALFDVHHITAFLKNLSVRQVSMVTKYEVSLGPGSDVDGIKRHFKTQLRPNHYDSTFALGKPQGIAGDRLSVAMGISNVNICKSTWSPKANVATAMVPQLRYVGEPQRGCNVQ